LVEVTAKQQHTLTVSCHHLSRKQWRWGDQGDSQEGREV